MEQIQSNSIITESLAEDAIMNNEFKGFAEDYLVLHCLFKKWKPSSLFEIGTNHGTGTKILQNAIGEAKIYTLDIEEWVKPWDPKITNLIGDSTNFDYSQYYPIESFYIDADHVYDNVFKETMAAIQSDANYIAYHDTDIPAVYDAIVESFKQYDTDEKWKLYRVIDTRISYAIKKTLDNDN